jgi:hypothetical protein
MSTSHRDVTLSELVTALPAKTWYLTSSGGDMWCKRPYGFFFSSGEAAEAFAKAMGVPELFAVGYDTSALLESPLLEGLRHNAVTRIFVDPSIDSATGDVFGNILRLSPLQ